MTITQRIDAVTEIPSTYLREAPPPAGCGWPG